MNSIVKRKLGNKECTVITIKQEEIEVSFMDYGASILSINTKDQKGQFENVLMAYEDLDSHIEDECYLNAIVGPIAGRIKNASYTINDTNYQLDKNFLDSENLHSGHEGISFKFFDYEVKEEGIESIVRFFYRKEKANSSFPGTVDIEIVYTVKDSELQIEFIGHSDADTLLNLTSHAYFNLSGQMKRSILDHELYIDASTVMTLDEHNVPVDMESLTDTFLDFTKKDIIRNHFYEGIEQSNTQGIDHPYILNTVSLDHLQASLYDKVSGRMMELYTTYPAVVVYTHNFPNDQQLAYQRNTEKHLAICFETQNHPNGINVTNAPSSILRKDTKYHHITRYVFSVKEG